MTTTSTTTEEEIEINFRLDANGRTLPQEGATLLVGEVVGSASSIGNHQQADYDCKTFETAFSGPSSSEEEQAVYWDDVLLDAEIADSGLMPRTFWVPAADKNFQPRCTLEQFAFDVFQHHISSCKHHISYDPSCSGAEWWVQIRPSPEQAGRYSMHNNKGDDAMVESGGISFHWDKDEDLRLLCGGNTYINPHWSTVTYLTSIGAPTLALNCRVNNLTGDYILPNSVSSTVTEPAKDDLQAFICWPKRGKHFCFDGRYLHAAPSDLMEKGLFEKQQQFDDSPAIINDAILHKKMTRRHRRVTFLVNIWLNYHPFNVELFPETMLDKMSGHEAKGRQHLQFAAANKSSDTQSIRVTREMTIDSVEPEKDSTQALQRFHWPMGDCDSGEHIRMTLPLNVIRSVRRTGGNIAITWENGMGSGSSVELRKEKRGDGDDDVGPATKKSRRDDTQ